MKGGRAFLVVEGAPETRPGMWTLYFDREDDALGGHAVLLSHREPARSRELRNKEARLAQRRAGGAVET